MGIGAVRITPQNTTARLVIESGGLGFRIERVAGVAAHVLRVAYPRQGSFVFSLNLNSIISRRYITGNRANVLLALPTLFICGDFAASWRDSLRFAPSA